MYIKQSRVIYVAKKLNSLFHWQNKAVSFLAHRIYPEKISRKWLGMTMFYKALWNPSDIVSSILYLVTLSLIQDGVKGTRFTQLLETTKITMKYM